jgi:hypothetical protein
VLGVVVVVAGFFSPPQPARPKMSPTLSNTHTAETIKVRRFISVSSPCLISSTPGG